MHPTNNRIADLVPEVRTWRRWLHQNPELQFDLPKTSRYIADQLGTMEIVAEYQGKPSLD